MMQAEHRRGHRLSSRVANTFWAMWRDGGRSRKRCKRRGESEPILVAGGRRRELMINTPSSNRMLLERTGWSWTAGPAPRTAFEQGTARPFS
jgi:hypothetical protein